MTEMFDFPDGELPDDLKALDAELSSIRYEERASFVPELRAELARVWAEEPARRRSARRRQLAVAAMIALLLGGAAVPSARASLVRFIGGLTPAEQPIVVEPAAEVAELARVVEASPAQPPVPEMEPTLAAEGTAEESLPSMLPDASRIPPQMLDREGAEQMLQDEYPRALQLGQIGGSVRLRMRIDAQGRVSEPSVLESSGFESLDRVALRVAPRFRVVPALQGGEPVSTWIEFPVLFQPDPARAAARPLAPVVDPMVLPTLDRGDWWQLSTSLALDRLDESSWEGPSLDDALVSAEASLEAALGDATILERYGPASAILRGTPEALPL
ncbi:MAG: TonB family protein, partial [Longimicrobiales bacterium]|nr:TonB family protein [Longimicrobiales bacterium]